MQINLIGQRISDMIDLTLFTDVTLFTLCELIINSNFATAEPGHFEMQNSPE